ncbi:MAG: Dps family protein [Bacilli bacterium]|jgi:starvation-inducible DNA-binding protein
MDNTNQQKEIINLLNQYLANIAVITTNLYNFHWNIIGPNFISMHKKLEEYYQEGLKMFDLTAERIKQLNGFPLTELKQYSELAHLKNHPSKDYTEKEVIKNVLHDFNYLTAITKQIINYTESTNDLVTTSILSDFTSFLEKEQWMLNANLK